MNRKKILILGGGGYVGGALVNGLLRTSEPLDVVTFDPYWFSDPPIPRIGGPVRHIVALGDIRHTEVLNEIMKDTDVLIHLACISNDPGFDLNPELGKAINYDSLNGVMQSAVDNHVGRVIYASSSSVYGDYLGLECKEWTVRYPKTDYAKYKKMSEDTLREVWAKVIPVTILRPATLYGWADLISRRSYPAMRFDLMFNSFVAQAVLDGGINVRGGHQQRALLSLKDMVDLYVRLALEPDIDRIAGKVWNVGHSNRQIGDLALLIAKWRAAEGHECTLKFCPTDDQRSYAISSDLIEKEYGFVPEYDLGDAYIELRTHLENGEVEDWNTSRYIRVKRLKELDLA